MTYLYEEGIDHDDTYLIYIVNLEFTSKWVRDFHYLPSGLYIRIQRTEISV